MFDNIWIGASFIYYVDIVWPSFHSDLMHNVSFFLTELEL